MSSRLHLPQDYREQVVSILRKHAPSIEAWAYGSRVDGSNHDASDLDLVLRTPDLSPIGVGTMAALLDAFDESDLPIIVDLHDWAEVPDEYQDEILRNHYVLGLNDDTMQRLH